MLVHAMAWRIEDFEGQAAVVDVTHRIPIGDQDLRTIAALRIPGSVTITLSGLRGWQSSFGTLTNAGASTLIDDARNLLVARVATGGVSSASSVVSYSGVPLTIAQALKAALDNVGLSSTYQADVSAAQPLVVFHVAVVNAADRRLADDVVIALA